MAALPPHGGQRERDLGDPHDGEAEHPQHHPGADAPGGGLAHQPVPAPRVHDEHEHEHELAEQRVEVEEAFVGGAALQERAAEQLARLDVRQVQGARHGGVPQRVRRQRPCASEGEQREQRRRASGRVARRAPPMPRAPATAISSARGRAARPATPLPAWPAWRARLRRPWAASRERRRAGAPSSRTGPP